MKHFYIFLFLLFCVSGVAQTDTTYIQKLPDTKVIGVHTTLNRFRISFSTEGSEEVFLQNYNLGVGVRFKIKKIGVSISVPIYAFNKSELGKPKSYGLTFGLYPKSFFVHGELRYHKGLNDLNLLDTQPERAFREDMTVIFGNVTGVYAFNADKFSLRSAFKMIDRQKQSAGSWLALGGLEYHLFTTDSLRLPLTDAPDFTTDKYQAFKFAIGGGYAYTWMHGNWSATGMITGSPEFRQLNYHELDTDTEQERFLVSPQLRFFGSILYNDDHLFYGLTGNYLPGVQAVDGLNTRVLRLRLRLTAGWRFW